MRAITIRQPHAWAVVYRDKVENRTRNIAGAYRGPVAIHAGLAKYEQDNMSSRAHRDAHGSETSTVIVYGAIIGVGELVDVHHADGCLQADISRLARMYHQRRDEFNALPDDGAGGLIGRSRLCSSWAIDCHYHLTFADMRPLATPIPYKGALGLWTLPDDVLDGAL